MAVTTTEVPTFFGPADSPLFGVVHLPVDNQIRGGVVICGSLGKEAMDSARLHRALADGLARHGFAVLRFDYLGTGDSAYEQGRDDAVTDWVASVSHALEYLTLIGVQSTTAIGIRAGSLILDAYLSNPRRHTVDRVVHLDPTGTGRRYLREHTTLFRLLVGEYVPAPGEVSIIGARLSERAAAEFGALKVGTDPVSSYGLDSVFVVGRPAETDRALTALAAAEGVESLTASGLPDCARSREFLLPMPLSAVGFVVDWLDGNVPTRSYRATPRYRTTVTMPAAWPGGVEVDESIERIEPNGLFAIRTRPRSLGAAPTKTVLFFVTNKDLHVGPNREWVELARRLAVAGSQALRWDTAGLGLSASSHRDPYRAVYARADLADSIAMAKHASHDAGRLEVVGVCSGAWYAAHVARRIGARSAILINLDAWSWRVISTAPSQWSIRRRALAAADFAANTSTDDTRSLAGRLRGASRWIREPAKSVIHRYFPRFVLRALSWLGIVWLPEDVLRALARRGTGVTVIAGPEDAEKFIVKGGLNALDRLAASSAPPRLVAPPTGDHSAHHPAILDAVRNALLPVEAAPPTLECEQQKRGVEV